MKKKYILLIILSPFLLICLAILGPFYFLHKLVDERSYEIEESLL